MSWGEIKKAINTDLTEPLNYLMWINDLKTYGMNGYVFADTNKLTELSAKSANAVRDKIAVTFLLEGMILAGEHIGEYFKKIIPSDNVVFDDLATIDLVANNETAMTVVANSETAMTLVIASSVGRLKIWESDVAINALTNDTTWALLKTLPQIVVQRGTNNYGDYFSGPYASKAIMVSARSSDALNRGHVRTKRGSAGDDISLAAPSATFLRRIAAVSNIEISNGGAGAHYGEVQYIMVEA